MKERVQVGKDLLSGRGVMKCLPQRKKWVSDLRYGNVEARVDVAKLSEGHCLKGVPRHGTIVESWGRGRLRLEMASKHVGDIVMQVRWCLGREGRITKVIVLQVSVVSVFIEKALETDVHGPSAKFVLPGSGMAGDTRGVFFALAGMKARADQFEVGDRRELEGVQVRGVLGSPFRGSEPRSPNFGGYPALKTKRGNHALPFRDDGVDTLSLIHI